MVKRVYIAGPYTHPDPAANTRRAILVGDEVWNRGFIPYVPHLTYFFHLICPHPYEDWVELDNAWIPMCQCLLRLSGPSSGADAEVSLALSLGIPVYHSIEALVEGES